MSDRKRLSLKKSSNFRQSTTRAATVIPSCAKPLFTSTPVEKQTLTVRTVQTASGPVIVPQGHPGPPIGAGPSKTSGDDGSKTSSNARPYVPSFVRNYTAQGTSFVPVPTQTPPKPPRQFHFKTPKKQIAAETITCIPETPPKSSAQGDIEMEIPETRLPQHQHRFLVFPQDQYFSNSELDIYLWEHAECISRDFNCGRTCLVVPTGPQFYNSA